VNAPKITSPATDRELLAALGGGDVESDDDWDRGDEQRDPDGAVQIAAEVGAECGEPDRERDVGHDLAE
jgi:hypothetical protein